MGSSIKIVAGLNANISSIFSCAFQFRAVPAPGVTHVVFVVGPSGVAGRLFSTDDLQPPPLASVAGVDGESLRFATLGAAPAISAAAAAVALVPFCVDDVKRQLMGPSMACARDFATGGISSQKTHAAFAISRAVANAVGAWKILQLRRC